MNIKLKKPFASDRKTEDFDVRQIKAALNRLGHYVPFKEVGMTGMADPAIVRALKAFQKEQRLPPTGQARPDDETVKALNNALANAPNGQYIWRTRQDDRVRPAHAKLEGEIRNWSDSPDPAQEYNCRCWAESVPVPQRKPKRDCKPEEEAYAEAVEVFKKLDQQRTEIVNELKQLLAEHKELQEGARNVFGINGIAGLLPGKTIISAAGGEVIESMVQGQSEKKLEENTQRKKQIKARIKHLEDEIILIISKLNQAADNVLKARITLEECRRSIEE